MVPQEINDNINHPKHYNIGCIEAIDVIEDWQLGFHLGNCIKYICRAKYGGNETDDILKAHWYLERYLHNILKIKRERS